MKKKALPGFTLILLTILFGCASYRTAAVKPEPPLLVRDYTPAEDETAVPEPEGELTLPQALALALMQNPGLKGVSYEIRAREAAALQASLLPNPELTVEMENFGGSGEVRGFGATESTLQLSQFIELSGKRKKRSEVAALGSDAAALKYQEKRLGLFTAVVKDFVEVLTAQRRVALKEELLQVSEQFLHSIQKRVEAGKVSPAEISRARVAHSTVQIELEQAQQELASARQRLAANWGSTRPQFQKVTGELEKIPALPPQEKLQTLLANHPGLARWKTMLRQQEVRLSLEKSLRVPDPTLSGGVRYLGETDDRALVFGLSLPIPLFNRNQGGIPEAEYRLRQAEQYRQVFELNLRTRFSEIYHRLSAFSREIHTLKSSSLPEAQNAYQVIYRGYLMGKFSFLDLLDARRTLFRIRSRYLNALQGYHTGVAELEQLIGQSLKSVR